MDLKEILAALNTLSDEEKADAIADAVNATAGIAWIPNPGPQTDAAESLADELFYGGQAGGGKGLILKEKILTPFGWTTAGELKVGSNICATDGTVQRVLRRFDRGTQPIYKLSWSDGTHTVCDADHIWLGWDTAKSRKIANVKTTGVASAQKWITADIFDKHRAGRDHKRPFSLAIPIMSAPCAFNVAGDNKRGRHISRTIPPYVLGVLIGDGCITTNVSFFSADASIAARVNALLAEQNIPPFYEYAASRGVGYDYVLPEGYSYREHLTDLGLFGKYSCEKSIPRIYLLAPVGDRWELLRGLMDTDGWADLDGDCYYGTTSPELRDDVAHLARSLGAFVTITDKSPTFTYKGETRDGRPAYALRIKMPYPERMFTLERKIARCAGKIPQSMSKTLVDIEPAGEDATVCFVVSNPNSLFIVDGFTVTHNTDLVLGLARTQHHRSLILRRTNTEARGLVERMTEMVGTRKGWNSQEGVWRMGGRFIQLGGCELEDDRQKRKGIPHDLKAFDEISDFSESQYTFIIGWNRSTKPGQRCRVIATGNPPTKPEGLWVIRRWAAWLDPQHPNPARAGELRWYTTGEDGQEIETDGPGPYMIGGRETYARSRTYIPARLSDNPDLESTGYDSVLAGMPEDLRRAYRDGVFHTTFQDDTFQAIPSDWIRAAQARWTPTKPTGVPLSSMGVDVAQGGVDRTVIARRYGYWFAPNIIKPGKETPDGKSVAGLVIQHRTDRPPVVVDLGGGWGGDAHAHLAANGVESIGYMGVKSTTERTVDQVYGFSNVRSKAYWRLREALDPSQEGGSQLMLPPGNTLLADLCAPKFSVKGQATRRTGIIELESKESVVKRLKRSPDEGDAVVMAYSAGLFPHNMIGGIYVRGRTYSPVANMKRKPRTGR